MVLTIHLCIAIATGLLVLYSDEQAFQWLRGKVETMTTMRVRIIHHLVTAGLALLLLTGGYLYAQAAPVYWMLPVFVVKMTLILALIVNSYFIERLSAVAIERNFASLSHPERLPLFIAGAISFACWATVFICGLILAGDFI
jgi:hypothetical protein